MCRGERRRLARGHDEDEDDLPFPVAWRGPGELAVLDLIRQVDDLGRIEHDGVGDVENVEGSLALDDGGGDNRLELGKLREEIAEVFAEVALCKGQYVVVEPRRRQRNGDVQLLPANHLEF